MNNLTHISKDQIFIGIDVAKDNLAVFIDSTETHSECPNQSKDLRKLAKQLTKLAPQLIVLEASGGYEAEAARVFAEFELLFAIARSETGAAICQRLRFARQNRPD